MRLTWILNCLPGSKRCMINGRHWVWMLWLCVRWNCIIMISFVAVRIWTMPIRLKWCKLMANWLNWVCNTGITCWKKQTHSRWLLITRMTWPVFRKLLLLPLLPLLKTGEWKVSGFSRFKNQVWFLSWRMLKIVIYGRSCTKGITCAGIMTMLMIIRMR